MKVGPALDLAEHRGRADDRRELHEMTDEVMAAVTALVLDLRDRYPKRWAEAG